MITAEKIVAERSFNTRYSELIEEVEEVGVENFTPKYIRRKNKKAYNLIYNKFRTFDNFINVYKQGAFDVLIKEKTVPVKQKVKILNEENDIDVISEDNVFCSQDMYNENIHLQGNEALELRIEYLEAKIEKLLLLNNEIIKKIDQNEKYSQLIRANAEGIVDIKLSISGLMKRYIALKHSEITPITSRKAYNEIYTKFGKIYNINLNIIQLSAMNKENERRIREGLKTINIINSNKIGFRKIDIIEELGMLPHMYLLIKGELDSIK